MGANGNNVEHGDRQPTTEGNERLERYALPLCSDQLGGRGVGIVGAAGGPGGTIPPAVIPLEVPDAAESILSVYLYVVVSPSD